jgi:HdeA/HdeB family
MEMNFLMNSLKYSLFGASFVLAMNMATQAETVDMAKFTCGQLLSGSPNAIDAAVWTSGYYNGMHKNTKLDLENMKHNADVIVAACKEDPKKAVMKTIDEVLAVGKKK